MAFNNNSSSIGTGISLQGKAPTFEGVYRQRVAIDAAEKARSSKIKSLNLDDFGIKTDKLLPAYATQLKNKMVEYGNRYAELERQLGSDKARNVWETEMLAKKPEVGALMQSNDSMRDYLEKKSQKQFLTPERDNIAAVAYNPNATAEDFARLNNEEYGITATPTFGFSASLTPKVDFNPMFDKVAQNSVIDLSRKPITTPTGIGGIHMAQVPLKTNDTAIATMAMRIKGNEDEWKNFKHQYMQEGGSANPDWNNPDDKIRNEAKLKDIALWVKNKIPSDYSNVVELSPPQPTQADKAKQWETSGNTYQNGKNVWQYNVDSKGDETFTFVKTDPTQNKEMEFIPFPKKGGNAEPVVGIPVRYEYPKDGDLKLIVLQTIKSKDDYGQVTETKKEVAVPYLPANADKITAEFGKTPFDIRQAVTGTMKRGESQTGKVKDESKVSSHASSGSSIPSATKDEWIKAGWSDEQINRGVKAGKIQVR